MTMPSCPNCGAPVEANARLCPNCGADLQTTWPPPPGGQPGLSATPPPAKPPAKLLTGHVWTDFLLGAAAQCLVHLATTRVLVSGLLPETPQDPQNWPRVLNLLATVLEEMFCAVVLGALVYLVMRRFYPIVARGSGYATLALLAVILGAFFTCHELRY